MDNRRPINISYQLSYHPCAGSTRFPNPQLEYPAQLTKMQNPPDKPFNFKDKLVMTPVEAQDFRKLNEFAEAAMIYRNPEKAEEIKERRKKKLQEHNQEMTFAPPLGE